MCARFYIILIDYFTVHISVVSYLLYSNGIFEEFKNLKNDITFFLPE